LDVLEGHMAVEMIGTVVAPAGTTPCAVCTILIGPGFHEARVHRDPNTGWRVCGACLASLRRQRERELRRLRGLEA
jgi:hypothetical protein